VGLDIRLPIGGMFAVVGLIIAVYGLATGGDERMYARALGVNINLWWGLIMLAFGILMLALGRRGARQRDSRPAADSSDVSARRGH
jgi:hypothetical protein